MRLYIRRAFSVEGSRILLRVESAEGQVLLHRIKRAVGEDESTAFGGISMQIFSCKKPSRLKGLRQS